MTVTEELAAQHPHLAKKIGKTVTWAEVNKVSAKKTATKSDDKKTEEPAADDKAGDDKK